MCVCLFDSQYTNIYIYISILINNVQKRRNDWLRSILRIFAIGMSNDYLQKKTDD